MTILIPVILPRGAALAVAGFPRSTSQALMRFTNGQSLLQETFYAPPTSRCYARAPRVVEARLAGCALDQARGASRRLT
jgi:hypothetical protein